MKITVVCDVLGAENNGAAVAALSLVRAMKQRGHEVVIVCSDEEKKGKEGYVVIPRLKGNIKEKGSAFFTRAAKKEMEPVIWDSDVVHIMTANAMGILAAKLCVQHRIPVTADFQKPTESLISRFHVKGSRAADWLMYFRAYNGLFRYVDAVRFHSGFMSEVFANVLGNKTNAYVIPDGVEEKFRPNDAKKPQEFRGRFVILYCAGYTSQKNHSVLIDAAARSKYSDKIQLVFAGDGPLKRALRERSAKLAHQPLFASFPHSQMPNVYNYADLYVHPAEGDLNATACMEALACGKVPIISDALRCDAKLFALDENNLFENRNARDLADKIDRFIGDPGLLDAYRERYRGVVRELSREACMDRMEEMFFDVRG